MGKQNWNTPENNKKIVEHIMFNYPHLPLIGTEPLEEIMEKYPTEAFDIIKKAYISEVKDEKVVAARNNAIYEQRLQEAKRIFGIENQDPTKHFDMLSNEEKKEYFNKVSINPIVSEDTLKAAIAEAIRVSEKTIERIVELEAKGKLKARTDGKKYSAAWVLLNITSNISQFDYLTDDLKEEWEKEYGVTDGPADEMVEVYIFQSSDDRNFLVYGGNIGKAGEKLFAISSKSYEELLSDRTLFNENKECIDIPRLSAILGNVVLGENPMAICMKVKRSDIACSTGGLSTAYFGEFGPPLSTQGGFYRKDGKLVFEKGKAEAVVPSTTYIINNEKNPNIRIISHGKTKTTDAIIAKADELFVKKQEEKTAEKTAVPQNEPSGERTTETTGLSETEAPKTPSPRIFDDPELLDVDEEEPKVDQPESDSRSEEERLIKLGEARAREEAELISVLQAMKLQNTETNGVSNGFKH